MIGVLLCGGRSLRMGNDKGMMPLQSSTWAEYVASVISSVCNTTVLSVNENQYEAYSNLLTNSIIILDGDIEVNGPLKGVLTVHLKYPSEDLLVLACDMIDMNKEVLKLLIEEHQSNANYDASVYKNEEQIEPLCAIYSSQALSKLHELLITNQLFKHSMIHALEQVNTNYIPLPVKWKTAFRNYNSPEDLALGNR